MPHSGGGGSSGGGYHGGSSSGSSSGPRISSKPYAGSHRYVYYYHHHPYYYYSTKKAVTKKSDLIYIVFFCGLFLAIGIFLIVTAFVTPKKLSNTNQFNNYVNDDAGFIVDDDKVLASLNEFKERTGVPTTVVTFHNDDWNGDFRNYLYNYYTKKYSDEYHLVIGYSALPNGSDWYFDTMFGDDTGDVFGSSNEGKFTKSIYNMLQAGGTTFESALLTELENTKDYLMVPYISYPTLGVGISFTVVSGGVLAYDIATFDKKLKRNVSYEVKENAKEYKCEYCGNTYVVSTLRSCPHCGAAISFYEDDGKSSSNQAPSS